MVGGLTDFTIACWVDPAANSTWSRVFDFGSGTGGYMFLTVNSGGGPRSAITTGGPGREQRVEGAAALPTGRWTHVAVTMSALVAILYVDGVQVGQNTNMGLYPARLGNTPGNWLGRSQNPADPFLNGDIDDFRIYQRGLDAAELKAMVVPGLIGGVADYIAEQSLGKGITTSLTVKLERALAHLRAGDPAAAVGLIGGDLIGEIEDLRGTRVPDALATELVRWAELIISNITAGFRA